MRSAFARLSAGVARVGAAVISAALVCVVLAAPTVSNAAHHSAMSVFDMATIRETRFLS